LQIRHRRFDSDRRLSLQIAQQSQSFGKAG